MSVFRANFKLAICTFWKEWQRRYYFWKLLSLRMTRVWPKSQVGPSYCLSFTHPWDRVEIWEYNSMPTCHASLCDLPSVYLDPSSLENLFHFIFHVCWFCLWHLLFVVTNAWLTMVHHACMHANIHYVYIFSLIRVCECEVFDWTTWLNDLGFHTFYWLFSHTLWLWVGIHWYFLNK